jgi:hypothetical protein
MHFQEAESCRPLLLGQAQLCHLWVIDADLVLSPSQARCRRPLRSSSPKPPPSALATSASPPHRSLYRACASVRLPIAPPPSPFTSEATASPPHVLLTVELQRHRPRRHAAGAARRATMPSACTGATGRERAQRG